MAEFSLDGRKTVKGLKEDFKKTFGASLRVYTTPNCKAFADEKATLASLRAKGKEGGSLVVKGNRTCGSFEKAIADMYGIGVQVANPTDSALAPDDITLSAAGKL